MGTCCAGEGKSWALLHLWACEGSCADAEWERAAWPEALLPAKAPSQGSRAKAQGDHSVLQGSLPSVQTLLQSLQGHTEHNRGSDLRNKPFPAVVGP